MAIIPSDWTPRADMRRIIVHWTGGTHKANGLDRAHYHILIEGDGALVRGIPSITGNDVSNPVGRRASHTLNCNTGSIGVSLCGMAGAIERPFQPGRFPITKEQWAALPHVLATLCTRYRIPVTDKTVLSHAEVQANLGIKQRQKWDISILPFAPEFNTAREVGDRFREWSLRLVKK
jgi:N-acetyl-anhydromuramyl-L-alanine amidase AmpD